MGQDADKDNILRDIAIPVNRFIYRAREIEDAVPLVPIYLTRKGAKLEKLIKEMEAVASLSLADLKDSPANVARHIDVWMRVEREHPHGPFRPEETLSRALFLGLFSMFDSFIGDLLRSLFVAAPRLLKAINGTVSASDIAELGSLDEAKALLAERFIDSIRRESYVEQFNRLEKVFGLSTLKAFSGWGAFVEAAQRRNVIAHCDGIASAQYIEQCKAVGVDLEDGSIGARLGIGPRYLLGSCRLLMEVAVKLTHVLWRKLLPNTISASDSHLHDLTYNALRWEEWEWALVLGRFAMDLKKHGSTSDLARRMTIVNVAIASRYRLGAQAGIAIMKNEDWSSCIPEFRLADAILRDEIDLAISIMKHIGEGGELIQKHSYYTWPLFRELRTNPKFQEAYRQIFGHDYVAELNLEMAKSKQHFNTTEEIKQAQGNVISDNIAGVEDFAREKSEGSEPQLNKPAEAS